MKDDNYCVDWGGGASPPLDQVEVGHGLGIGQLNLGGRFLWYLDPTLLECRELGLLGGGEGILELGLHRLGAGGLDSRLGLRDAHSANPDSLGHAVEGLGGANCNVRVSEAALSVEGTRALLAAEHGQLGDRGVLVRIHIHGVLVLVREVR